MPKWHSIWRKASGCPFSDGIWIRKSPAIDLWLSATLPPCMSKYGKTLLWCPFSLSPPSPYYVSPTATESQWSVYLACISTSRAVIWLLARPCCLLADATTFISFGNLLAYHRQLWKIEIHTVTIWFSDRLHGEALGRLAMVRKDFLMTWTVSKLLLTQTRACLDEKWMCSSPCPIVPSSESGIYHERYIKKH